MKYLELGVKHRYFKLVFCKGVSFYKYAPSYINTITNYNIQKWIFCLNKCCFITPLKLQIFCTFNILLFSKAKGRSKLNFEILVSLYEDVYKTKYIFHIYTVYIHSPYNLVITTVPVYIYTFRLLLVRCKLESR